MAWLAGGDPTPDRLGGFEASDARQCRLDPGLSFIY
jgi:hypothetical protein